jgi:argininosuccinate lyase
VFGPDAIAILRAENSVARRTLEGGPAPSTVKRRLKELGRR